MRLVKMEAHPETCRLTVDPRLKPLSADLARQIPQAQLLIQLYGDRVFVVAE